ncbi:MAG: shikimate dehydrogenase [Spirochaetes bacterium]|uniref:Multifunctional fusion protein n=1 Tax=Candidatus Ornithospirochaeta stercoripullorum TaxID=2840899 RepID=A0A9D9DZA8_9SPIO|nr:shikimate dehydrogenase [Candidatus Ornithospirochaeta stercoripullorum]
MICLTLSGNTLSSCLDEIKQNRQYIDLAELRVDLLQEDEQKKASSFPSMTDVPVILTLRRKEDGGKCVLSEKERRQLLLSALDGDFAYVDIEEDVKKTDVEDKARSKGIKIIRSFHDFSGIPDDIYSRIYRLAERGDIAKAAVTPHTIQDLLTLFRIAEELKDVPKIIIGMGDWGIPIRILYKKAGSLLTFASSGEAVAPGQVSAKDLKMLYRADQVNERTGIYGVIGNPVLHTSSPLIHNTGFHAINYNAIYLPFLVDNVRIFFALAEYLKMRGFSVTIPFKDAVLMYLGNISREVKQIGACNTVVRMPGMWKGLNTDYYGFLQPVLNDIDSGRVKSALVIGAGGASQAVVWALRNRGVKVTILNRTVGRAEKLAKINLCEYDTLSNASKYEGKVDLVVQTTSVGLYPDFDISPIDFHFTGKEIAYDIIYKPKMTKFLKEAEKAGCTLHFGSEMLMEQGKLQFELFTGYHYPKDALQSL